MDNPKRQKIRLMLGWFFVFVIFTGLPFYFTLSLSAAVIFYLYLATINYIDKAIYLAVAFFLWLPFIMAFMGQAVGVFIVSRFYTREEMYKILTGIFRRRPVHQRRELSVNRRLERLYKQGHSA